MIHSEEHRKNGYDRLKSIFIPSMAGALKKVLMPVRDGLESNSITWKTKFEADRLETTLLEHCHSQ